MKSKSLPYLYSVIFALGTIGFSAVGFAEDGSTDAYAYDLEGEDLGGVSVEASDFSADAAQEGGLCGESNNNIQCVSGLVCCESASNRKVYRCERKNSGLCRGTNYSYESDIEPAIDDDDGFSIESEDYGF